jgi:putative hemolysin
MFPAAAGWRRCQVLTENGSALEVPQLPWWRRGVVVQSEVLTYSSPDDPRWKRWTMRAIEDLSGRRGLLPVYYRWRKEVAGKSPRMMGELLDMVDTRIDITAAAWPAAVPPGSPLVIVANHPFGIGDGLALLALAEQLGRPYRILINSDFMRVPEIRPHALPIDFSGTPEAVSTNLETRRQARRLLKNGVTIVVFPAGGVATAEQPFGKAEELPWKSFTTRLIQLAEAAVLPVYFEGQNSALFHFVSRYSLAFRLALLVSEFRYCVGAAIKAHVGNVIPFTGLESRADRNGLTAELYACVHRLAPGAARLGPEHLKARPPHLRRRYPWDDKKPR